MKLSQKLTLELTYDLAIPLLDTYPNKMKTGSQRDTCSRMFTAALFTVDGMWKQPVCEQMTPYTYIFILHISV